MAAEQNIKMIVCFPDTQEFDNNGDGFIDPDELKLIMSSVGESLSDKDLDEMIKEADKDGDGKVSFQG